MPRSGCEHGLAFEMRQRLDGERLIASLSGWMGHMMGEGEDSLRRGCFVVTDRRLAYYRQAQATEELNAMALEEVTGVLVHPVGSFNVLTVRGARDEIVFMTYEPVAALRAVEELVVMLQGDLDTLAEERLLDVGVAQRARNPG